MKDIGQEADPTTRLTILLVEDEAPVRSLVKSVLERQGFEVLEAISGPEALEVWRIHASRIVLLFTDMVMPDGISGRELARRLQAEKKSLRVLYTTGYALEVVAPELIKRPDFHFLLKPYRPVELVQAVRSCLADPAPAEPH